jgi:23S rRNA pseudouridine2604 synthase
MINNPITPTRMPIRINKFLASTGICSRRQADELIKNHEVTISGKRAKLGDLIEGTETVMVNGKQVKMTTEKIYLAFHKPYGVICTTDPNADNNIIDYIKFPSRIFPIGRLDVESSGLILLTNDGDIVNKISKAQNGFEKEYLVTVDKEVTPEALRKLSEGVVILDGKKTLPAKTEKIGDNQFSIVIIQGMNRQIRRMCEAVGYAVKILKRVRINTITLEGLGRGKWRNLTKEEVAALLK